MAAKLVVTQVVAVDQALVDSEPPMPVRHDEPQWMGAADMVDAPEEMMAA